MELYYWITFSFFLTDIKLGLFWTVITSNACEPTCQLATL